jgi:hypothetical protein
VLTFDNGRGVGVYRIGINADVGTDISTSVGARVDTGAQEANTITMMKAIIV